MKLSAIAASVTLAVALSVTSSAPAFAQTPNKQNQKPQTKKEVKVVIKQGDNLSSIATAYKTTFVRLYNANTNINDPDMIFPGDTIRVPDPNEKLADRPLPVNAPVDTEPTATVAAPAAISQTAAAPTPVAAPVVTQPQIQAAPVSGCGDNSYANYIYMHESGCRTTASSPNGCYGIGQACPASKIAYCGTDYDCQNAYFTSYANKYGGWEGAYNFWVSHGWW